MKKTRKKAWKQHYERLLNVEFPLREEDLSTADPLYGPLLLITKDMVENSVCKMKNGKVFGPSNVVTEMLKSSSDIYYKNPKTLRKCLENPQPQMPGLQF